MFDDLSQVKRRYEELAHRMTTPEAMNDPAAYAAMMREYKELTASSVGASSSAFSSSTSFCRAV